MWKLISLPLYAILVTGLLLTACSKEPTPDFCEEEQSYPKSSQVRRLNEKLPGLGNPKKWKNIRQRNQPAKKQNNEGFKYNAQTYPYPPLRSSHDRTPFNRLR